ncbi:hypothetical protein J4558_26505 [Leptolyngbya sp. 15MV]|nr:hypothetical protein J4558_26505 [Leptolyngbya sp. 15MV]
MNEQSIFIPPQSQGGGAPRGHDPNPLEFVQKLHRLFRGRYLLAGVLASVGAIAGAVGGYLITQPTYTATGSLRIRAGQPVKLSQTELSQPLFNAYQVARDHANLLQEPRVVERAMLSPEWRALGKDSGEAARDAFTAALRVVTDRDQPTWIRVQFTDLDRQTARIAVEQVLAAYREIHGGTDLIVDPRTVEELTQRKRAKEAEITQRR